MSLSGHMASPKRARLLVLAAVAAVAVFGAYPSSSSAVIDPGTIISNNIGCIIATNGCPSITASTPSPTAGSSAAFTFTYPGAIQTYTCTLDGAATLCGGSAAVAPLVPPVPASLPVGKLYAGLADGVHTFSISGVLATSSCYATNPIGGGCLIPGFGPGGSTAARSYSFIVDTQAPVPSFTSGPADLASITKDNATFGFTATDLTAISFKCAVDGKPGVACASPFALTNLKGGAHKLQVIATDVLGHASAPITRTFAYNPPTASTTTTVLKNGKVKKCKKVKKKKHGHVVHKKNGKIKYVKKCRTVTVKS